MKYYTSFDFSYYLKTINPFYVEDPTESGGFDPQDKSFPAFGLQC